MKPETCDVIRIELSARLDGEADAATALLVDDHLSECVECRRHERNLAQVRRLLRAQPAESVPDLSQRILERAHATTHITRRTSLAERLRIGGVAAVATALLLAGGSLLELNGRRPDLARAAVIVREIRSAARSLTSFRASYTITERGWHRLVPVRRFTAKVSYFAPEHFRLRVRDQTVYPGSDRWPRNDVDLIANQNRWWIREPISCPTEALPSCIGPASIEERTVVHRQPFDGSTELPTDIVVPLESLASSGGFEVLGRGRVAGRNTWRVRLTYLRALPLVNALEAGGSWRTFEPDDRVDLWIDEQTWFPLRFEVFDNPVSSKPALSVEATSFGEPDLQRKAIFDAPRTGLVKRGGFAASPFTQQTSDQPEYTAGLPPYRSGLTDEGQTILAYADGMTWLKVTLEATDARPVYATTAESVELPGSGIGYYEPASEALKRRLHIYTDQGQVQLESNLRRAELIKVASSFKNVGEPVPARSRANGYVVRRLELPAVHRLRWAKLPVQLPDSYRFSAASLSEFRGHNQTLSVYYRGAEAQYDGIGIHVTQSPDVSFLPPSFERFQQVNIDGQRARYSPQRHEIEWIDNGIYRSIKSPVMDLPDLVSIAEGSR